MTSPSDFFTNIAIGDLNIFKDHFIKAKRLFHVVLLRPNLFLKQFYFRFRE